MELPGGICVFSCAPSRACRRRVESADSNINCRERRRARGARGHRQDLLRELGLAAGRLAIDGTWKFLPRRSGAETKKSKPETARRDRANFVGGGYKTQLVTNAGSGDVARPAVPFRMDSALSLAREDFSARPQRLVQQISQGHPPTPRFPG